MFSTYPYLPPPLTPLLKLILCNPLPHRTRTTNAAGNHLQHIVNIIRPAPLLMRNHIDLILHFRLLHQFPVRTHPLFGERAGKLVADEGGRV